MSDKNYPGNESFTITLTEVDSVVSEIVSSLGVYRK